MDEEEIQFTQDSDTEAAVQESVANDPQATTLIPYRLTEQGVENFRQTFGGKEDAEGNPINVDALFAQTIAKRVATDSPRYQNLYDDLRSGTMFGKEFNDREIIQLLARDKDGNKLESGSVAKGFMRELVPSTTSMAGFYAGAKAGSAISAPIPPLGPVAIGAKLAIPTLFGVAGALGAYELGEEGADFLFGEELLLTPGTKKYYEAGKTGASAIGWLPLPFLISDKVSFGAAQYLDNLIKSDAVARIGPPTAEELSKSGVKNARGYLKNRLFRDGKLVKPKLNRTIRFTKAIESFLNRTGTESRKYPFSTIGSETAAAGGGSLAAFLAEQSDPGDTSTRLGAEFLGNIAPASAASIALKRYPQLKQMLKAQLSKYKGTGGLRGGFKEGLNVIKTSRQAAAAQDILEKIELMGEDPKKIIALLQADETLPEVYRSLTDEFQLERLLGNQSTAAMKTGSPALMAIEAHYAAVSPESSLSAARSKANQSYSKHFRDIYNILVSTGDKESLQQAAEMSEEIFNLGIKTRLTNATNQVVTAFERVKGFSPENNMALSQKLHDVASAQIDLARKQEKILWNEVGNVELEFNPEETINFIEDWENVVPDEPIAREQFNKLLPGLDAYVQKQKKAIFGEGAEETALSVFETNLTKMQGTPARRRYETIITRDANSANIDINTPSDDAVEFLQAEANRLKNQSGASSKDAAKLLRLKAEEMIETLNPSTPINQVEPETITVRKLQDMRSLAISHGRRALAQGDDNTARLAYSFADAVLRDLEAKLPENMNASYDLARSYSRSLNDTFTRAFAGDILSVQKTGAERLAPELLASRLLQGGDDPTLLRIQEMREMLVFANNAMDTASQAGLRSEFTPEINKKTAVTLDNTIDKILRNARAASMTTKMDPLTGEITEGIIDPIKLKDWMDNNEELLNLDAFSNLKDDLSNSSTANQLLKKIDIETKEQIADRKAEVNFQNLMPQNSGSPNYVAGRAITNPTPIKSLDNIVNNIKAVDNPEQQASAMSGFRSAILDYVMTKGGKSSKTFSPKAVYQEMFEPMKNVIETGAIKTSPSGERTANVRVVKTLSLADYMVSRKVLTPEHRDGLETTLKELLKIETADAAGNLGNMTKNASALVDFYLRITGSALGTRAQKLLPGGGGSGELIAAGAGSKMMRQLFQDMPRLARDDVIAEMMENPTFLAEMLEMPQVDRDMLRISKTLQNFFEDLGFTPVRRVTSSVVRETGDEINEELTVEQPVAKPPPVIPPVSDASPSMNAVRGGPQPVAQATPPASPPAQADPQTRQRYAALFPNDPTSAMIKGSQGGIGSLFG